MISWTFSFSSYPEFNGCSDLHPLLKIIEFLEPLSTGLENPFEALILSNVMVVNE